MSTDSLTPPLPRSSDINADHRESLSAMEDWLNDRCNQLRTETDDYRSCTTFPDAGDRVGNRVPTCFHIGHECSDIAHNPGCISMLAAGWLVSIACQASTDMGRCQSMHDAYLPHFNRCTMRSTNVQSRCDDPHIDRRLENVTPTSIVDWKMCCIFKTQAYDPP